MNQLFPTYASEVGFSPMVGGFMVSAASLFDLFLNPIVGTTCDRFGSTKAILGWLAVSILSFVMLMMSSGNSTLSIFAAGVKVMIVGGLGPKAVAMFNQGGVEVFVGAAGTVKDAIDDWRAEMLAHADMDNACKDHKH